MKNLLAFFRGKRLGDISSFDVERYKAKRRQDLHPIRKTPVAPASINRELALLKHLFTLAIQWGKARTNPVKGVKLFREENTVDRILTPEEERHLLEATSPTLKPILLTALYTGMRLGEVLGLTKDRVDFREGVITVTHTKNGRVRRVPMNKPLTDLLRDAINKASPEVPWVFARREGQPIKSVREAFEGACRRAGITGLRFHDLRHTAGTRMSLAGVDLPTVKEILGHATILTTLRYAHPTSERRRRAVEALASGQYMDSKGEKGLTAVARSVVK